MFYGLWINNPKVVIHFIRVNFSLTLWKYRRYVCFTYSGRLQRIIYGVVLRRWLCCLLVSLRCFIVRYYNAMIQCSIYPCMLCNTLNCTKHHKLNRRLYPYGVSMPECREILWYFLPHQVKFSQLFNIKCGNTTLQIENCLFLVRNRYVFTGLYQNISPISGNSEIPEICENVGKFSPGKFREIFPRIFLYFPGMKHMLQP